MFNNKSKKGFTLIEILLYFGLFALIIGIAYPIYSEVLKNYLVLRGRIDIQGEMRNIFIRIQNELFKSKSVDILTDWEIIFNQPQERVALFQTKPVYLDLASSTLKGYANNLSIGSISFNYPPTYTVSFFASSSCAINSTTNIPSQYAFSGYAWSPNIGWLKFRNDAGEPVYGVCLDNNNELRGYAWNDVVGWVSFNCADLGICGTANYKVVNRDNYLYGYAWNDVIGWLIFDGQAGKIYIGKMNPDLYYLDLISDPRVFVEDFRFTKVANSFKVNLKVKGAGETYYETESTVIPPFK